MFAWSGGRFLAGIGDVSLKKCLPNIPQEEFSGSKSGHSRVAMTKERTSQPTICGEWRLQWDLSVQILLPKCHQGRSLCLAAGGDVSLHSYLSGQAPEESQLSMLACFLIYHSVPTPGQLAAGGLEGEAGIGNLGSPGSFHWAAFPCPPAAWEYTCPQVSEVKEKQLDLNFGSSVPCLGLGQECPHIHEGSGAYPRNPVLATDSHVWHGRFQLPFTHSSSGYSFPPCSSFSWDLGSLIKLDFPTSTQPTDPWDDISRALWSFSF